MSELVVLLDPDGHAMGTAAKAEVHHAATPLHLAFSAYLFDPDGALLVTQRARSKATFPGLWTNSVCGHPGPGEPLAQAVIRRASDELGIVVRAARLVLPEFAYVAQMDGVVENEWCPVFTAVVSGRDLDADPAEVGDTEWVPWTTFATEVLDGHRGVSTWCRAQVEQLVLLGPGPGSWPTADPGLLPPAARIGPMTPGLAPGLAPD